jgi:flotillin
MDSIRSWWQRKKETDSQANTPSQFGGLGFVGVAAAGALAFIATRFRVAKPNQRFLESGLGIKTTRISRWCIQWPIIRQVQTVDLSPITLRFNVHALSEESLSYVMPMVWTLAPNAASDDCILRYGTYALGDMSGNRLTDLMTGIIEGEARILAGKMGLQEIQNNREKVQTDLVNNIVPLLKQFGMHVHGGTISDLQDTPGQSYFEERRKRALAIVSNEARVQGAQAKQKGDIGVQHADTETRKQNAALRCEAALMENEQRKTELESEAKLKIVQAEAKRQFEIAEVLSAGLVQVESAKMRKQVEELRAQELLAKQRANELMTVQVAAEKTVEESKGAGQAKIVDAKAAADAILLRAEAEAKQIRWKAEAQSFAKQEEGRGLKSYLEQKAEGVAMLKQAIGSAENLQRLLMIEQEVPTKIAQFTAKAVEGLKPRITITNSNWNRGTEGTDAVGSDALGNIITNTMMQTAQVAKEAARITGIKILPEMLVPEDDKKT